MRVGILTYPNSYSVGATLQMYSLYRVLEDLGCDAEIINYDPPNLHNRLTKPPAKLPLSVRAKMAIVAHLVPQVAPKVKKFESVLVKNPAKATQSKQVLCDLADRYDKIIVGSDQVWNEKITGSDFSFYLDFCADSNKKASYAASFGNTDVPDDEKEKIASLLSKFKAISVREAQGVQIVESLIGKKPTLVLDPTLLITPDKLREHIIPTKEKKYVLCYTVKPSLHLQEVAKEFAQRNGYIFVNMNGRIKDRFDPRKHTVFGAGPREFLGLVDGAEYVFTNSFHGVAISVAFETPFYVEYSSNTNSRLQNMVELFNLPQCVVDEQTAQNPPITIDYTEVSEKVASLRKESLAFLRGALE